MADNSVFKPPVFVWQFRGQDGIGDHDYGSGTPAEDDGDLPIGGVLVKALDGVTFMGAIELSTVAIESPQGAQRVAAGYASRGIPMVPWGVHQGASVASAQLEGARAGACAAAAGPAAIYVVDLEDGPGYWEGDDECVDAFIAGFKGAGGRELRICLDSRGPHLQGEHLGRWIQDPIVTQLMPQIYWPDFQQSVSVAFDACVSQIASFGLSRIAPVFPAGAPAAELAEALSLARAHGLEQPLLWRRGTLTPETVGLLRAQGPWEAAVPAPAPAAEPAPEPPVATEPATPAEVPPFTTEQAGSEPLAQAYDEGWGAALHAVSNATQTVPFPTPRENPYRG